MSKLFDLVYEWCGTAYCLADDDYPNGVCACDTRQGGFSFMMVNMPPCTEENCPLMRSFRERFPDFKVE